MSNTLTDTQLMMLSAAAQRDDRCLVIPQNLRGGAAQRVAAKLVAVGLVKEFKAKAGMPVWRRDEPAALSYALKLTAAGAKAIVVEESPASQGAGSDVRRPVVPANSSTAEPIPSAAPAAASALGASARPALLRSGTKIAHVMALLQRDSGATLDELIAATGWLPHTTRAALTGLRRRGYAVAMDRTQAERGSTYRIPANRAAGDGEGAIATGATEEDGPPAIPEALMAAKRSPARRAREAA
jgi:Protein of unknown function (DUF3489)